MHFHKSFQCTITTVILYQTATPSRVTITSHRVATKLHIYIYTRKPSLKPPLKCPQFCLCFHEYFPVKKWNMSLTYFSSSFTNCFYSFIICWADRKPDFCLAKVWLWLLTPERNGLLLAWKRPKYPVFHRKQWSNTSNEYRQAFVETGTLHIHKATFQIHK